MLTNLKKKEITVCAIVTDSAPAYAAAWCQIRISKRSITFLLCFAHQINLCVDEIFKEFTEFKTAIDYAIRLAAFLRIQIIDFLLLKMGPQLISKICNIAGFGNQLRLVICKPANNSQTRK
ncbi:hypothetical protein RclHR1_09270002 [Rhizophagus clarus]|uniref:DUF659 domain-containing protein n=1 Tax=Rhizophagus clarus TaxID=94130 RepID=A0A2Z6SPX5_9GLOM|nr:hypothetical protein RclHR1_09270002 [Rhizophagus clarus]